MGRLALARRGPCEEAGGAGPDGGLVPRLTHPRSPLCGRTLVRPAREGRPGAGGGGEGDRLGGGEREGGEGERLRRGEEKGRVGEGGRGGDEGCLGDGEEGRRKKQVGEERGR